MPIRQITIVGTGLIGGSFALALRKQKFAGMIVGCDRESALKKAKQCGAIEKGSVEPADAVRGSQLVVLATPVLAIVDLIGSAGAGAACDDFADGCGKYEVGSCRAGAESVWQECWEAVSGGASDGREGTERRGVCGCGFVSECGLVLDSAAGAESE